MRLLRNKITIALLAVLSGLGALLYLNRETKHSVVIHAPLAEVWEYASDSTKAREWSVYFHHISPLPGVEDGKVGSLRRCYRRADETGPMWDEEVVAIEPMEYRQIRTFNLQGFGNPVFEKAVFKVHQRYKKISDGKTRLEFGSELIGPWDLDLVLALLPAASETKRIFRLNLENIKAAIEQGEYNRPHPYEPKNLFDDI